MIILNELLQCLDDDIVVLAGQNGLNRSVYTVTVLDALDAYEWLRGNELILTSGYIFEENTDQLETFISHLIQIGSSGVGIKIGRFMQELPEKVKALADNNRFPILKIPYRFVWTDVISPFYNLKYSLNRTASIKIEPEMISFVFEANKLGANSLLKQLTQFFRMPMAVIKDNNEPVQFNNVDGTEYISEFLKNNLLLNNEMIKEGNWHFFIHLIPNKSGKEFIVISSQTENDLHEISKLFFVLDNISGQQQTFICEKPEMYRNFIYKVVSEKISRREIADFDRNRNLKGVVYNGFFIISAPNYEEIYAQIKEIAGHFKYEGTSVYTSMVYNLIAEEAVVFIEYQRKQKHDNINCFFRRLFTELDENLFSKGSFIATGLMYEAIHDVTKSYREAVQAKHTGHALWGGHRVYYYDMVSPYILVYTDALNEVDISDIMQLVQSRHNLAFDGLETLEMFLETGSYKKTAQRLYIHENTLRYRIQKISELLYLNLNSPIIRHSLLLKIKLWRLRVVRK